MSGEPRRSPLFTAPVGPWHDWFAWRPVRTHDQRLVWLRWVRRRPLVRTLIALGSTDGPDLLWQHYLPTPSKPQGARHG